MKKKLLVVLLTISLLLIPACSGEPDPDNSSETGMVAYASFYPMYDFTLRVAGERIHVINLIPSASEPHGWEPTAADIVALEKADLFIYNGAGMEPWVENLLPTLTNEDLIVVDASEGLTLLHGQAHSHDDDEDEDEDDDDHEDEIGIDPHVWLSPVNARRQMENILHALILADPDGEDVYRSNYEHHAALMDDLDASYRDALAPYTGQEIIVAHEAFGYLTHEYDLIQVAVEGLTPDSEPDPARVAEIIKFAEDHHVRVIFFEEAASSRVADTIASAINAETAVLRPVAALSSADITAGQDYISVMKDNLQALVRAFELQTQSSGS